MKKILEFLSEDSSYSTMRLGFMMVILAGFICFLAVAVNIILFSIRNIEITQWGNMGVFLLCVGGAMTGLAWKKADQKKVEISKKNSKP